MKVFQMNGQTPHKVAEIAPKLLKSQPNLIFSSCKFTNPKSRSTPTAIDESVHPTTEPVSSKEQGLRSSDSISDDDFVERPAGSRIAPNQGVGENGTP